MKISTSMGALVVALGLTSAANAAINVSIYYNQLAAASNATIAQAAGLGAANGTTTVNAINFNSNDSTTSTIGAFLGNPVGLNAATATHILNNTYFLFTGQTFLNAGANSFVVPHDDGLEVAIAGIGTVLSQPGPTAAVNSPFTVNAPSAGLYNFTIAYGETAGGPAVLRFNVNGSPGGVPEPASWALLMTGFGMVGFAMRRRTTDVVTA
jgi:hypothetical protein